MEDRKKRALFIARGDWAGVGYYTSQAINSVGAWESRAISYTQRGSYTNYPHDILDLPINEIEEWWNWADVIVLFDNADTIIPVTCKTKPTIEAYNGSWYRADPYRRNTIAKNKNRPQVCMTPDLSKYGPTFVGRPISIIDHNTDKFPEFTIMHCPTSRTTKGTDRIISELGVLDNGVKLKVFEGLPNNDIIELKKQAHVVIDQVKPGIGGSGYGVNALEAWSLGIPVICDPSPENLAAIIKEVGYTPFVYPSGSETLASIATRLKDDSEFYNNAVSTGRKYINEFHSDVAVSNKWSGFFESAIKNFVPEKREKKISVCMIVINESANIGTAIASTRGLADEIVIVDTGSTDTTIDLCKSLGCRVFTGYDNMHKGNARNSSIENSTGEWIVILDADEEIVDPYRLRKQIEETSVDTGCILITAGSSMGLGSIPTFKFYQHRCWPRNNLRYSWRAHEVPNYAPGIPRKDVESDVIFAHYPTRTKELDAWKLQYTLDRLLLDVAEHPDAPRPLFYLGRQYLYLKRYDEAISSLGKFLEITEKTGSWDRADACYHLYQCYIEYKNLVEKENERLYEAKAIRYLYFACLERPTNRKWWFDLGTFYFNRRRYNIAVGLFKCMLEVPESDQEGFVYMDTCGSLPYELISRSLWHLGRYEEGFEYARKAIEKAPNDAHLKDNLSFFVRKMEAGWRMDK